MRTKGFHLFAILFGLGLTSLLMVCLFPSDTDIVLKVLGTRMPQSQRGFLVALRQAPGYLSSEARLTFELPFDRWDDFCMASHLDMKNIECPKIGVDGYPSLKWWNPPAPDEQLQRACRDDGKVTIVCIWHDNRVWIITKGSFGAWWR